MGADLRFQSARQRLGGWRVQGSPPEAGWRAGALGIRPMRHTERKAIPVAPVPRDWWSFAGGCDTWRWPSARGWGADAADLVSFAPAVPFCCDGLTEKVSGATTIIVVARHPARRNATHAPEAAPNNIYAAARYGLCNAQVTSLPQTKVTRRASIAATSRARGCA